MQPLLLSPLLLRQVFNKNTEHSLKVFLCLFLLENNLAEPQQLLVFKKKQGGKDGHVNCSDFPLESSEVKMIKIPKT